MRLFTFSSTLCFGIAIFATTVGCTEKSVKLDAHNPELAAVIELMMPKSVKIENFTQPISEAGDGTADAIEVVLSANDSGGDPVKVVGVFQFELLKKQLTTSDLMPKRVAYWREEINSSTSYNKHWNPYSNGYRFALRLNDQSLKPGDYQLRVQLTSATGEHIFDERAIHFDGSPVPPMDPRY